VSPRRGGLRPGSASGLRTRDRAPFFYARALAVKALPATRAT